MLRPYLKSWVGRNTRLAYVFLIALGTFGAWLVGMFDYVFEIVLGRDFTSGEVTLLDLALSFLGLVIFCAAGLGVVILIARNRKPMTSEQGTVWEQVRNSGKWSYVFNFVSQGSKTVVLVMIVLAVISYWQGTLKENIKSYLIVAAGIVICLVYAAINSWVLNESEYSSLQSRSQHDKSLQIKGD